MYTYVNNEVKELVENVRLYTDVPSVGQVYQFEERAFSLFWRKVVDVLVHEEYIKYGRKRMQRTQKQ